MLHGLVHRRVERLALGAEGLEAELLHHGHELVGDRLERAAQVAVRAGPLDVVEHREQLADELGPRVDQHRLAVAVDPPPVVRVLGGEPLQVRRALRDLGGQLGDAGVVGRGVRGLGGRGGPGAARSPSGVRTAPVSGSIRPRSGAGRPPRAKPGVDAS